MLTCFPDCVQDVAPVTLPMVSTTVPLTEWYWPVVWLRRRGRRVSDTSHSEEDAHAIERDANANAYLGSLDMIGKKVWGG